MMILILNMIRIFSTKLLITIPRYILKEGIVWLLFPKTYLYCYILFDDFIENWKHQCSKETKEAMKDNSNCVIKKFDIVKA